MTSAKAPRLKAAKAAVPKPPAMIPRFIVFVGLISTSPAPDPSLEEVQSSMRDVKIDLLEDRLRAYVVFDYRGKNLSLLLEGRLPNTVI